MRGHPRFTRRGAGPPGGGLSSLKIGKLRTVICAYCNCMNWRPFLGVTFSIQKVAYTSEVWAFGAAAPPGGPPGSASVSPSRKRIFSIPPAPSDVDNHDQLAREEVFGPVMAVIPFDDDADAVRIANDSNYGLGGSVRSTDEQRGLDVARQVRTGTIGVNYYNLDLGAPFGGMKDSGIGRELGPEASNP